MKYHLSLIAFLLFIFFCPSLLVAQGEAGVETRDIMEHLALKKDVPKGTSWTYVSAKKDIEICLNRLDGADRLSVTFFYGLGHRPGNAVTITVVEGGRISAREHTRPGKTRLWKPNRESGKKPNDILLGQLMAGLSLALEIDIKIP